MIEYDGTVLCFSLADRQKRRKEAKQKEKQEFNHF